MENINEKLQKVMEKVAYESLKEGKITETTDNELENVLYELFWNIFLNSLYTSLYSLTIFWLKFIIVLVLLYQILNNLVKYIDSRGIRFRYPVYVDENS